MKHLKWLLSGFIYPCFRLDFYQGAVESSILRSVALFVLFAIVLTALNTIRVLTEASNIGNIQEFFNSGELTEIVIEDGKTTVVGKQPLILYDVEGTLIAVDTTGDISDIDRLKYFQGFLLTETSFHMLHDGDYQTFPLNEILSAFEKDKIVINEETTLSMWKTVLLWAAVILFTVLLIWFVLVRFMYLTFIAVLMWGFITVMRRTVNYGQVLTVGLLALVPLTYAKFLLSLVGIQFFFLFTILLIVIWGVVLLKVFPKMPKDKETALDELDLKTE